MHSSVIDLGTAATGHPIEVVVDLLAAIPTSTGGRLYRARRTVVVV